MHIRVFREMTRTNFPAWAVAVLFLLLLAPFQICHAVTFDWPTTPAWAATGPASGATETIWYGYYANGSVKVSVFNNGETFQAGYPGVAAGGGGVLNGGTTSNGLILYHNNASNVVTNYSRVTIDFLYTGGASNITFNLWDVDLGAGVFTDKIANIVGTTLAGATVQATTITPSAGFNQVNGTVGVAGVNVTGVAAAGNTSAQGNVTIGFSQTVKSISFEWSNTLAGGTTQAVGVSPVTFTGIGTAFPEIGSASGALSLCGGLLAFRRRRKNATRLTD